MFKKSNRKTTIKVPIDNNLRKRRVLIVSGIVFGTAILFIISFVVSFNLIISPIPASGGNGSDLQSQVKKLQDENQLLKDQIDVLNTNLEKYKGTYGSIQSSVPESTSKSSGSSSGAGISTSKPLGTTKPPSSTNASLHTPTPSNAPKDTNSATPPKATEKPKATDSATQSGSSAAPSQTTDAANTKGTGKPSENTSAAGSESTGSANDVVTIDVSE